MNVYIDTTLSNGFTVSLLDSLKEVDSISVEQVYKEAEELLPSLQLLLSRNNQEIKNVKEVWVVSGPGRFSATRIGVAVANALCFAASIPMRSIKRNSLQETVADHITKFAKARVTKHVEPVYDKAPNITKPTLK